VNGHIVLQMAIPAARVPDAISAAADLARGLGLAVQEPVLLRSTNNAVAWLRPADVVAKISTARSSRLHKELQVTRELCALGAPVVCPAPELPCIVHARGDLEMTFWRHHLQPSGPELSSGRIAPALKQLHSALRRLSPALKASLPSYRADLEHVRALLANNAALPAIAAVDRHLLATTFDRLQRRLDALVSADKFVPIHGEPHSYNVLIVGGEPAFIDFECVCMGPVEWDLACLDDQAVPIYGELIQPELLWLCGSMASVKAATLCAADIDRGDMREHAEWHLAQIREQIAPSVQ
jgi:phosphotransferase family enzyme